MATDEYERGFREGIAAAVKLCREGADNKEAQSEAARQAGNERVAERRWEQCSTWDAAADMIEGLEPK